MAGAQPPNENEEEKIRRLIQDFVGERLRRKGISVPGYDQEELINENSSISEIALTLRRVGDEFEMAADTQFVANMCTRLSITPNTAYPMFQAISDKIFASGKNWGRVVAFLTFGSSLAVHCAEKPDMGVTFVDTIVSWIHQYVVSRLGEWIKEQGGLKGFMDFFKRDQAQNTTQNGFLMSALAGVGLGAFLMMTFK
ncbi:bcl-2-like protein 1 [Clytia hemisphaerica]|uniref:Bcl-2 Bcl-2 homology region 1-3 domain-containing protein n=1 Tax=Clytia hemisphaerica TaxID=252671 RepID=A0A7M5VAR7_9CNID